MLRGTVWQMCTCMYLICQQREISGWCCIALWQKLRHKELFFFWTGTWYDNTVVSLKRVCFWCSATVGLITDWGSSNAQNVSVRKLQKLSYTAHQILTCGGRGFSKVFNHLTSSSDGVYWCLKPLPKELDIPQKWHGHRSAQGFVYHKLSVNTDGHVHKYLSTCTVHMYMNRPSGPHGCVKYKGWFTVVC